MMMYHSSGSTIFSDRTILREPFFPLHKTLHQDGDPLRRRGPDLACSACDLEFKPFDDLVPLHAASIHPFLSFSLGTS